MSERCGTTAGVLVQDLALELELAIACSLAQDHVTLRELARQHTLGQRVLDVPLDGALQGARAVLRVPAELPDEFLSGLGELDLELTACEALRKETELDVDDLGQLLAAEPM